MKSFDEVYSDIKQRFEELSKVSITENSVMDMYSVAIADVAEDVYEEIENNKTPHIYSRLNGRSLDDLGFFMNTPREEGESDATYLFRLMNWKLSAEAANRTAIDTALLNMEFASNAEYIPLTKGSGTGSVYIIPINYELETISEAIHEAMNRVEPVVSPGMYVDYIVPDKKPVIIHAAISADGDKSLIRREITRKVEDYVNSIAPNDYLNVGAINKIGINEELVNYFSVLQIFIDGEEKNQTTIFQQMDHKYLLDEIVWSEE